ncbi:hypothetical protein [Chryseobacterium gossypii]|uniref:hypothetical protein n=1 Tax=Chryseobacterium gossypii TaxID=3231602 RepID=UPI003525D369
MANPCLKPVVNRMPKQKIAVRITSHHPEAMMKNPNHHPAVMTAILHAFHATPL